MEWLQDRSQNTLMSKLKQLALLLLLSLKRYLKILSPPRTIQMRIHQEICHFRRRDWRTGQWSGKNGVFSRRLTDGAYPGCVLEKPKAQKYKACLKMWREKSSCSGSWPYRPFKGIQRRRGAFLIFEHKAYSTQAPGSKVRASDEAEAEAQGGKNRTKSHLVHNRKTHIKKDCRCCSATQPCLTLCDPRDCSPPGFPVLHCLLEFAQTHVR